MRNLFKKSVALSLATVMTVGAAGVISARVADDTNIATGSWESFSVCTNEDHVDGEKKLCWKHALEAEKIKDEKTGEERYMTYGVDFATEGSIDKKTATSSNFDFNVVNSGWDGEYDKVSGDLIGDNPWGLTASMTGIQVEAGRSYTIEFDAMSTIIDKETKQQVKHVSAKAHQIGFGDAAYELSETQNITADGMIALQYGKLTHVKAVFTIPEDYRASANGIGFKFAFGAFLKSYPDEIAMTGQLRIRNFAIKANHQNTVNFVSNGKTVKSVYVNNGEKVKEVSQTKKGYTFGGWYNGSSAFNFNSAVNSDLTLTAKWIKTTAPKKATIKKLKSNKSKKLTVTIKKVSGATGYKVFYSKDKKFKKAVKKKSTKKTTYTISKLKSGVKYYVRVKAYKTDSLGNEVLSKKYSKVKGAYVN
ncbi:MAG: InlB B-repeat-containing protein [Lachnospiraceae bacterium]|nr:InlB B-repeat-containing protein [Lachnospiraceae bacterium]